MLRGEEEVELGERVNALKGSRIPGPHQGLRGVL